MILGVHAIHKLHAGICSAKTELQRTKYVKADPRVDTDSSWGLGYGTTKFFKTFFGTCICSLL